MKLAYVIVLEIIFFWILLFVGSLLDYAMNKVSSQEDDSYIKNVAIVNVQIVAITLVSVLFRPLVLNTLVSSPSNINVQGVGLLYAFAMLLGQQGFKARISRITNL